MREEKGRRHTKTRERGEGEIKLIFSPLQMLVYVVVQLVEEFESEATKPSSLDVATGSKVNNTLFQVPTPLKPVHNTL